MGKLGIVVVVLVVDAILVPITEENILGLIFTSSVKKNDIFRSANKNFTKLWPCGKKNVCFLEHSHEDDPFSTPTLSTCTYKFYYTKRISIMDI